jgi:hypothetical protein
VIVWPDAALSSRRHNLAFGSALKNPYMYAAVEK